MADPAKLELLTRSPGAADIQIVELESRRVYWAYRPRRLPATEWEITAQPQGADGARHYVLRNLRLDRYLLLNANEHFLWEYFDGRHSLEEIARVFHLTAGAFDHSLIRQLLVKLYGCGLLENRPGADFSPRLAGAHEQGWTQRLKSALKRWRGASFTIPNADRFCSVIYDRGGFLLFHSLICWATLGLAVSAIALVVRHGLSAANFAYYLKARPFTMTGAMLIALLFASMLHTLVHALACKSYGRRVRELGFFLLQGVLPAWYVDVTDIFMSSRRARVIVDFSGPMVEVVLGSAAIIGAHAAGPGIGQALLFGIAIMLWESALINLYPFSFLEMDGYNILADLAATPMLRQQALALMPSLPRRFKRPRSFERAEWLQLGYLALCAVSVLLYLIAHLDAISSVLHFSTR
jgi:putative peptide zinc metalloprotease protein